MKPRKLSRDQGVSMLIFGMPGVGKTRLIATGPRTLIIRPPADHVTSVDFPTDAEEIVVRDWSDLMEAQHYVFTEGYERFDWVWLDSVSLFQDYGMEDVMADAIRRKPDRAIEKGGERVPEFGPDKGEYRTNMDRVAKFVRDMQGLAEEGKINLGLTAHPFEMYDPVTEEDVFAPWIQGRNMVTKVCGYMNIVAYLSQPQPEKQSQAGQTILLTRAKGFYGKDQYECFPELKSGRRGIVNPTMPKVIAAIEAVRKQRKPKRKARRRKVR